MMKRSPSLLLSAFSSGTRRKILRKSSINFLSQSTWIIASCGLRSSNFSSLSGQGHRVHSGNQRTNLLSANFLRLNSTPTFVPDVQVRHKHQLPWNTVVNFVPQQEAWVVERMGRFFKILEPGLNFLLPIIDEIKYVQSLKEIAIVIPQQSAITVDNVALQIDGVLYLRVEDPFKASYGVEDPEFAISQLAQTTMRSEVGKISLDTVFREREALNVSIVEAINKAASPWGISCKRYEIRDMTMPPKVQEAMQMQVEAERRKRATVLESEGVREAEINVAEGRKKAVILQSEASKQEKINMATGEAQAIVARAQARAMAIKNVADSLQLHEGQNAASLGVAEQYVSAFSKLAKENNTIILPANASDASGMVAQALTVYKSLTHESKQKPELAEPKQKEG